MEAPSSSQTCKVLDCAVAPVVHIIMENGSKAPKAIRMAPEGAPTPQGLALYVITEEIIVSLPALTHRQRGMIKIPGITARCGALDPLLPGSGVGALALAAPPPQLSVGRSRSTADGLVPLLVETAQQRDIFCAAVDMQAPCNDTRAVVLFTDFFSEISFFCCFFFVLLALNLIITAPSFEYQYK